MRNQFGIIQNPFDKGYLGNALDRLFPSSAVYYSREEVEAANPQSQMSQYQRLQTSEHSMAHGGMSSPTRGVQTV
jgi:hypothetical protein